MQALTNTVTSFLPYVTSFYDVTVRSHNSMEEVFRLLMQAIIKLQMKKLRYQYSNTLLEICVCSNPFHWFFFSEISKGMI